MSREYTINKTLATKDIYLEVIKMAKFETTLFGEFDDILEKIQKGILGSSVSATLEDSSDFCEENSRCSVRVFERYSTFGGNRVSMTVVLFQNNGAIKISAITAGGSQAVFMKVNTFGEEAFLKKLKEIVC